MRITVAAPTTAASTQPAPRALGIMLMDASKYGWTPEQIKDYGGNLVVNQVKPGSRAEKMGMLVGDVIKQVNDKDVKVVEDVVAEVRTAPSLEIEIIRDQKSLMLDEPVAAN